MSGEEIKKEYGPYLKEIMCSMPVTLFLKDAGGTIIGKCGMDIQPDESLVQRYGKKDREILATGRSVHAIELMYREKKPAYIDVREAAIRNDEGEIIGIFGLCNDVTELEMSRQQYKQMSLTDPLTGLYNRNYMLEHDFDDVRCLPCSYILCDCNGLKQINDRLGHEAGDRYLMEASKILKEHAEEDSVIIRWGGDEFLIITPGSSPKRHEAMIRNIRNEQKRLSDIQPGMGLAVGGLLRESMEIPESAVMKAADEQMYADKAASKRAVR